MALGLEMKNYVAGWRFNCGGAVITANTVHTIEIFPHQLTIVLNSLCFAPIMYDGDVTSDCNCVVLRKYRAIKKSLIYPTRKRF